MYIIVKQTVNIFYLAVLMLQLFFNFKNREQKVPVYIKRRIKK